MKVISTLADIEFGIGRMTRRGRDLVVESDAQSTMETTIVVTPEDARATLRRVLFSGSAWSFLLRLPFSWSRSVNGENDPVDGWAARRKETGLNKPW